MLPSALRLFRTSAAAFLTLSIVAFAASLSAAPILSYSYSPRLTADLDRNALNDGVAFSHEPPSFFNCSYVHPAGNAPTVGTVTYAFETASEERLTNVVLSQDGVLYTNGKITGEFSTDGGRTFQRFFETAAYQGQPVTENKRVTLRDLDTTSFLVRYTLSVTNGSQFNVQFLRDCDDGPFALKFDFDVPVNVVDLPRTLTLNAAPGGTTSVAPGQLQFPKGSLVTLTATPSPGYVFRGWYGTVLSQDNPLAFPMLENASLTPLFGKRTDLDHCTAPPDGLANWWAGEPEAFYPPTGSGAVLKRGLDYAPGHTDLGFSFDGIDDYLQIGKPSLPPPWTVAAWVSKESTTRASVAFLSSSAAALKLEQFGTTKKVGLTQYGIKDWAFNYSVPTNAWTHLTFVAADGATRLYVNGQLEDSIPIAVPLPLSRMGIGVVDPPTDPFRGTLDEIETFNRALSSAEIANIFSAGTSGLCKPPQFQSVTRSGSGVSLRAAAPLGKRLELLQSADLENWTPLMTLDNPEGLIDFPITQTAPEQFFQLRLLE